MSYKIIFIVGATATGKTDVSFMLARKIKAEIVSCDAMLMYRESKIITAKPPDYMLRKIKHHFVGVISARDTYSVFDFYKGAKSKITSLFKKNVPVIVCGGSGLYVKALLDGIFEGPQKDEGLRKELAEQAQIHGNEYLYDKLTKVDPEAAKKISINDLKRLIRALEVYSLSGEPISAKKKEAKGLYNELPIKIFGLRMKRSLLYERINKRVDEMVSCGAVREVKRLLKLNLSETSKKIIGIKEIQGFLDGKFDLDEAVSLMKKNTRNFAKRQTTWFRKDKRIEWIDVDNLKPEEIQVEIQNKVEAE